MIIEINLTVENQQIDDIGFLKQKALSEIKEGNGKVLPEGRILHNASYELKDIKGFVFKKKSIDARRGLVKVHLRYHVYIGEEPAENDSGFTPAWKKAGDKRVVIIGNGPCGLFAALTLLEHGIKPLIVEQGSPTSQRKVDIANISRTGEINPHSNYCFGEGGAGTFSDGKLYTRSNKRGNTDRILSLFCYHGASKEILTDAHPHVGTNKLPSIINNMNKTITDFGGEVLFNTQCTDFIVENGICKGVEIKNLITEEKSTLLCDNVIVATGHSATDMYYLLEKKGALLETKTFAIGVRVEHPRTIIDTIQYKGKRQALDLPAAEYRLVTQVEDRGVYSFCMCPGGLVVPSASSPGEIVVNGMSPSSRDSKWSNAAIVVEVRPEDIPPDFGSSVTSALAFRTAIEKKAFEESGSQKAPAQKLVDFLKGKKSVDLPESSYTGGLVSSSLEKWMPSFIIKRLQTAFNVYNTQMRGFICPEALLIAPETRTSTPLRIVRDNATLENPKIKGLYPAGEGSGYSGGIVSSAMDGERVAMAIINKIGI